MRLDIAREGKQVEVKGPMLRCKRAEEGSNMGRHLETLRVYSESRTQGVQVLKPTAAACVSHGICRAKNMADVEPRFGLEEGRHRMQVFERTLRCIVCGFVIDQVEGCRERVKLNDERSRERLQPRRQAS